MGKLLPVTVLCALVSAGGGVGHAADDDATIDCKTTTQRPEAAICGQRAFDKADGRLNRTYRTAVASQVALDKRSLAIDPSYVGAAQALRQAQRYWIGYRDKHCETVGYQDVGGRMQSMAETDCRTALTESRTAELKALIRDSR